MMTKLFTLLALVFFSSVNAAETPLSPEVEAALANTKKAVRAVWTAADHGSSTTNSGVYNLGADLPANAIITSSYAYVATQVTDGGTAATESPLIGFQCEDSNNILGQYNFTGQPVGAIVSGKQSGPSTYPSGEVAGRSMTDSIAADCAIQAKITKDDAAAGRIVLFVEYVTGAN